MEKVAIGVIGAGRWGPNLIRNFNVLKGGRVCKVADFDKSRLRLIQDKYPDVAVTESADEVVSDPTLDAVVVCTPTATHFEWAHKPLENGKHVFVEKPLAMNDSECSILIELAHKKNRTLFVGHVFIYNSAIQVVRDCIHRGDLGKLLYLQITRTNLGPVRSDVSALWDLAPHDLSILQYWLGEMPNKVSAVGGRFLSSRLEDVAFATYTFPSELIVNIHVSWLNPKKVREIVVVGEKKMLIWDDMNLKTPVQIYNKSITVDPAKEGLVDTFVGFRTSIHEGELHLPKIIANEPLVAECTAFLQAIHDPDSSLSTGEHGRRVVQALMATDQSLRKRGREITIKY